MPWERWLYAWRARLRGFLYRDRTDRELDEELQHHLALDIEARCTRGVPRAEARRQALVALGGLASAREHVRASRFGASLGAGLRDVRHGLRLLRRHPGFTAATVLTLTLSIGATTAIFSVVDAVLLQPPSFSDPERLVTLWQTDPDNGNRPVPVGPADFLDWQGRVRSFETRGGDGSLVARFHRRRRAGDHRMARHGGLLRDAGRQGRPRSHVPAGGVPAGERRDRPDARSVAAPLRGRTRHHRALAAAGG